MTVLQVRRDGRVWQHRRMPWTLSIALAALPALPPRMGPPADGREAGEARVAALYDAIDAATSDPELRAELRRRCRIESWCNWYGVVRAHPGDASLGRKRWRRAVDRGLLHPEDCPAHRLGDDPAWWSTVGPLGNVSAYVMRHAGDCVHPRVMLNPQQAAKLAVSHAEVLCRRHDACDCPSRARWWAGPGRWDARRPLHRLRRTRAACGPQGFAALAVAYAGEAQIVLTQIGGWLVASARAAGDSLATYSGTSGSVRTGSKVRM